MDRDESTTLLSTGDMPGQLRDYPISRFGWLPRRGSGPVRRVG